MRNIAIKVSYDGTDFNGYQIQPRGRTVQGELEKAIRHLSGEEVTLIGSGRTDAGVHAMGQVCNFRTTSAIPVERWAIALNTRLPGDVIILEAWEVPYEFHSSKSAKRKTYRYTIDNGKFPDVFRKRYRFHHPARLDTEAMSRGLAHLIGTHDYTSFTSTHSTKPSHIRTIYEARLIQEGSVIHIELTGNGFLYNMVRVIAGTMMFVGQGKLRPDGIKTILDGCDRSLAGPTAMPHALMLVAVEYDE
ncbi:tRNA pseudouridine(38-40) synthase TruA [Paenibacillus sp. J5C_2022]|uniref:tRNA pseudouridine(38-40) synthase TruA n=1 Tax=Paenibacillus sp. J5C2022 TaxID=2977129 RepID=UPI0021D3BF06|nr:tRNA pseudouridine(38-40) synthase TruA [Paenibacillus sp. J5C2022]MCU6711699.1 tRNA pseudouridine(38-40) synthase TruA [Paenibacillus sp. J5C2022]